MKMHQSKPYPELPLGWTVARQGGEIADYFYAYNYLNGQRGSLKWTYDEALKDAKRRSAS